MQLDMFEAILNRRLDIISRRDEAPFFGAGLSYDLLLRRCKSHMLVVAPHDKQVCKALRAVMTEMARLRMHGIADVRCLSFDSAHLVMTLAQQRTSSR